MRTSNALHRMRTTGVSVVLSPYPQDAVHPHVQEPEGAEEKMTYYDCFDAECLCYKTPEDAIRSYLSHHQRGKESEKTTLRRVAPIIVHTYETVAVSDTWATRTADRLADRLEEWFEDEYGSRDPDPEGDPCLMLAKDDRRELAEFVRKVSKYAYVHRYVETGHREYSEADILEWLK